MRKTVLFGRYRLDEPLGTGGSAQVWRATDKRTGDVVAVKRLHPVVFADQAGRERLLREFRALRDLDEPHVVRVRDLELTDDDGALILDYVAGTSLANRLTHGPRLSTAEAVQIALDIAAALAAAHEAGIVHRDVTPGNILLDPDDGARLTDFGIALAGAGTDGEPALTATGELVGTLRYLAPEQLRGAPATPASDVHALAAVTYEMLSGRQAYAAATPVALAEAHARGVEPIASIPPALDAAIRQGLAPDPADRPPDAAAFAAEIRQAIATDRTEPIAPGAPIAAAAALPIASSAAAIRVDEVADDPEPGPMWEPAAVPEAAAVPSPRARGLPFPLAVAMLIVLAGAILGAAIAPSFLPVGAGPVPSAAAERPAPSAAPSAPPSVEPTAAPTPPPAAGGKNEGGGKGKGEGDGKGKGHKGGD
ncbi:MAG: serine/threonine-protein kinase [Chloroflexota bacterium]